MQNRQKKLKEARRVAQEDIEQYKTELEDNFEKRKIAEYGEEEDQAEKEAETQEEITRIESEYEENKENVIEYLIGKVMNVNLEIPKVVRGDFESA